VTLQTVLQAGIAGALTGGLYALMALGLSLTWGLLRVINLTHFAMILVGAYLTFELATRAGIDPLVTVVVTAPALFIAGAALQWAFDRFDLTEFNSLLVTFGLLIVVVQLVSNYWSADFQRMTASVNPYAIQSLRLGPFAFPTPRLLAFIAAVVLVGGVHIWLQRTYPGRALRAFAQDRTIAAAFGIDHVRLGAVLGGVAGATAAVAGMLIAVDRPLTPSSPFEWFGIVFAVVILGGIGNAVGTLLAGIIVGAIAGVVSAAWSPSAAPLVIFSLIIVALLVRPRGLFVRGGV
jgi:branched-chain amino acid transport system permease protein